MKRSSPLFLIFFLTAVFSVSAWDWGLLLDQTIGVESFDNKVDNSKNGFYYSASLIPWFSSSLGESGKLYLSAGTTAKYYNEGWYFIPELLRTEFSYRIDKDKEIKAGRVLYGDPLGFIAKGLFDGAAYSQDFGSGRLGAEVFYTGLIYKENQIITMTANDFAIYYSDLNYNNFADTYFTSRRLLAILDWENAQIRDLVRLKFAVLGQFDLNGNEVKYHSQYFLAKAVMPLNSFVFNLGACLEFAQVVMENSSTEFKVGLAGELGAGWKTPAPFQDQLALTGRFSSGTVGGSAFAAFVPVTTVYQGDILEARLSGLSVIKLDYTARIFENFSFNVSSSYFILSDLGSYMGFPMGRDGHLLGNEFFGRVIWSPLADLRIHFGGGLFIPAMGNASNGDKPLWRVELNAVLVVF